MPDTLQFKIMYIFQHCIHDYESFNHIQALFAHCFKRNFISILAGGQDFYFSFATSKKRKKNHPSTETFILVTPLKILFLSLPGTNTFPVLWDPLVHAIKIVSFLRFFKEGLSWLMRVIDIVSRFTKCQEGRKFFETLFAFWAQHFRICCLLTLPWTICFSARLFPGNWVQNIPSLLVLSQRSKSGISDETWNLIPALQVSCSFTSCFEQKVLRYSI